MIVALNANGFHVGRRRDNRINSSHSFPNVIFRSLNDTPLAFIMFFSASHQTNFNSYFHGTLPISYLSQHYPFIAF